MIVKFIISKYRLMSVYSKREAYCKRNYLDLRNSKIIISAQSLHMPKVISLLSSVLAGPIVIL